MSKRICLYCGNEIKEKRKVKGFFTTSEYYCGCKDIKTIEEIDKKIQLLEDSKPKEKYYIGVETKIVKL